MSAKENDPWENDDEKFMAKVRNKFSVTEVLKTQMCFKMSE
jgi:hypothetical protein